MVEGGSLQTYAAMMKSMDAGIGRVLKALDAGRLDRNTLVIFTSDNGGERYSYQLAVLVSEVPCGRGHSCPRAGALAGHDTRGPGDRAGGHDHGLDGDDPRRDRDGA